MNLSDEVLLGCCGAYCKTCRVYIENACKGCKLGYLDGTRDLSRAKCRMKVCCISKGNTSCADCDAFESCHTIQSFFLKNGYKYKKYKEALFFIRSNGYKPFFTIANMWTMQYGRYK